MQIYLLPMLQRPHFPMPHFILASRDVKMFSVENPRFKKTGRVKRIITGGPQITATVLGIIN